MPVHSPIHPRTRTYTHHSKPHRTHIPPQEGFHDLRKATERRYLEYRRDHLAKAEAAQRAAEARKAQRTRRWVGLSSALWLWLCRAWCVLRVCRTPPLPLPRACPDP